ncbi:hypothetical protein [Burkholderia plantarii]
MPYTPRVLQSMVCLLYTLDVYKRQGRGDAHGRRFRHRTVLRQHRAGRASWLSERHAVYAARLAVDGLSLIHSRCV